VPVRFSLTLISLSDLIRRLVDLRLEKREDFDQVVQDQFEYFTLSLPARYSLAAVQGLPTGQFHIDALARISKMERWIIHQQIFHAFLELHHFEPSRAIPEACISFANHILDIQLGATDYCHVMNSLNVNVTNVVKACSLLVCDLMQKPKSSNISRGVILRHIHQAICQCQAKMLARLKGDEFSKLHQLLELEEKIWQQSSMTGVQTPSDTAYSSSYSKSSPVSTAPTTVAMSSSQDQLDMGNDWLSFLPSDAGLYPVFSSSDYAKGLEWNQLYESFLAVE
jgi:hypothetical protein